MERKTTMNSRRAASSREKIVQLLRRRQQSVNDLAHALRLTDNAVRANLARLERGGLIHQAGSRATRRKPESVYDITPQTDRLFAKAYAPALATLLTVMEARFSEKELDTQLREAGRRLAAPHLPSLSRLPFPQRARKTLQILEDLGGLAELKTADGRVYLRGFGCPFSQVVADHPKLCLVAEVMISELLGREVREQCERGDRSRCCFVLQGTSSDLSSARRSGGEQQ